MKQKRECVKTSGSLAAPRPGRIAFTDAMVRAIQRGTKTVTRRVVRPQPPSEGDTEIAGQHWSFGQDVDRSVKLYSLNDYDKIPKDPNGWVVFGSCGWVADKTNGTRWWTCRHGPPGRLLYVLESFAETPSGVVYRADHERPRDASVRWLSPRFMRAKHCRTVVRVSGVRPERLHAIDDDDAKREGFEAWTKDGRLFKYDIADFEGSGPETAWDRCERSARSAFAARWNAVDHGPLTWEFNPLVWRIEFCIRRLCVTNCDRANTPYYR